MLRRFRVRLWCLDLKWESREQKFGKQKWGPHECGTPNERHREVSDAVERVPTTTGDFGRSGMRPYHGRNFGHRGRASASQRVPTTRTNKPKIINQRTTNENQSK